MCDSTLGLGLGLGVGLRTTIFPRAFGDGRRLALSGSETSDIAHVDGLRNS